MLLLTDRPTEGRRLQQVMGAVEACALAGLDDASASRSSHAAIVCDVALDRPAVVARVEAVLAHHRASSQVPVLLLSPHMGETALGQARAIGATAVLPRDASDAQVVFTVRQLVKSAREAFGRRQAMATAVQPSVRATAGVFKTLLDAALRGRPLDPTDLAKGGEAVVASVGQYRIGAWLDVVRAYDDTTYQHSLLVAGLTASFAAHLGVTLGGQRALVEAALIHDIGKATIPHAILNKPGRLAPAEVAAIREHPVLGHDMLVRQGGFAPQLLDIVRHHHEYPDGSGYPDGLRGERVSPPVRLVTICDIYAALVERRAYKPAMGSEEAFGILAGMGGKLDAGMVAAFRTMIASA